MMRWDILNFFIAKYNFKSYLEIGVQDYYSNCSKIQLLDKTTVDPYPRNLCNYVMTSNEFFQSQIVTGKKWDLIFIDGLHHESQAYMDVINSLEHLTDNGIIMCHDCLPTSEHMQLVPDHGGEWTGDVWKAFTRLRCEREDLYMCTIDTDYGCGIIKRGKQELFNNGIIPDPLDWNYFSMYRNELMNVISPGAINTI